MENKTPNQDYLKKISRNPSKKAVQINKMANNSQYIPIGYIEEQLDAVFYGMWSTRNFTYMPLANEIVGSIELVVYLPDGKELTRIGAASAMIQQSKGANLDDISSKIKNTLVKDFPHLKSECLKNAAKSLGNLFGRNLNRNITDSYVDDLSTVIDRLKTVSDSAKLVDEFRRLPEFLRDELKDFFTERKKQLESYVPEKTS